MDLNLNTTDKTLTVICKNPLTAGTIILTKELHVKGSIMHHPSGINYILISNGEEELCVSENEIYVVLNTFIKVLKL